MVDFGLYHKRAFRINTSTQAVTQVQVCTLYILTYQKTETSVTCDMSFTQHITYSGKCCIHHLALNLFVIQNTVIYCVDIWQYTATSGVTLHKVA